MTATPEADKETNDKLQELASWLRGTARMLVTDPDSLKVQVRKDHKEGVFLFLVEADQKDIALLMGKEHQNKAALKRLIQSTGRRKGLMTDLWIQAFGSSVVG